MNNGTHHIGLTEKMAKDVLLWLVSGSPGRTEQIADLLEQPVGTKYHTETERRLPVSIGYLIEANNEDDCSIKVGAATTGMGMSSTEITMVELIGTALKANPGKPVNIIRIGTAGTHQPEKVYGGDLVIANDVYTVFGAVSDLVETRHDSAVHHFDLHDYLNRERELERQLDKNPTDERLKKELENIHYNLAAMEIEKVGSCDKDIINYICQAADEQENVYLGPVFSKQTLLSECHEAFPFLQPQGKRKIRLEYRAKVLHNEGILASEMEEAMLTSLASAMLPGYAPVRIGGIMAIVNNPRPGEGSAENQLFADGKTIEKAVDRAINLGLETAVQIYKSERKD